MLANGRLAGEAHGRIGRRTIPEARRGIRRLCPRNIFSVPIRVYCSWLSSFLTMRCAGCVSADTIRAKCTLPIRRPSNIRARPTVILARTIKGYGLGEAGEGKNITHQQKKLNEDELRIFRSRFAVPLNDQDLVEVPFYRPPENSLEIQYLRARREALGGYVPQRSVRSKPLVAEHR